MGWWDRHGQGRPDDAATAVDGDAAPVNGDDAPAAATLVGRRARGGGDAGGAADPTAARVSRLRAAVPYAAAFAATTAVVALVGWATGSPTLKCVVPGMTSMKVNTAFELLLLSAALFSLSRGGDGASPRWAARAVVGGVFVLCALTAAEYVLHVDLGIDQLLFVDRDSPRFPGRNAPGSIACLSLLGLGLLLLDTRRGVAVAHALLAATIVVPLATVGGYLYRAPGIYAAVAYPVLALHTAAALVVLCLGALFARAGDGLMGVVTSESAAGAMARRLLPLAVALPLGVGLATLAAERAGLFGPAFGSAMLVSFCALFFAGAVWWTATLLGRAEARGSEAEHGLARARAEATEYAERFRQVADVMPLIVWAARADGAVDFYNDRWYAYTDVPRGQVGDAGWLPAIHPDDAGRVSAAWAAAVRAGAPFELENRLREGSTGEHRWFLSRARPVTDGRGGVARWYGTCTDIDDQKRSAEAAERSAAAAAAAQADAEAARARAEAAGQSKDLFLAVLSHELRTPLTPVLATVGLIEASPDVGPRLREELATIRRNVEAEARLIDDLLDMTRLERGTFELKPEVVDVHAVVARAADACRPEAAAKGVALDVDLAAAAHDAWADAARLQQVFTNLIHNAVKFSPAGAAVRVRTEGDDGRLRVVVHDDGVGIEPEILPRLFRAFEQGERTVTRRFGGLGLGLAICRAITDLHGGTLAAESPGRDRGATFTLELPLLNVPAAVEIPAPAGAAPLPLAATAANGGPPQRLLLVEDHADTRRVMTRLLQKLGYSVLSAGSVREALDVAERHTFDLLVSDIGLPDGTGLDVMRALKQRFSLKGIAVSGFGQEDDLRRSREAGFETHLIKPVDFRVLERAIRGATA